MTLHIASTYNVVSAVRSGMRVSVRSINDGWLIGPCATDLDVHLRLRLEFWADSGRDRAAFVASYRRVLRALDADEPVVLWTSLQWNDRVALWALCSYRLQRWPTQPDLSVVRVGQYEARHASLSFGIGYVTIEPAMVRDAWKTARPLSLREVRRMARLWQKLAAPSPILSRKPLRETQANKELLELGVYQAGFFPKQTARGLSLSTLDALLLACVNQTPSTPAHVLAREDERGDELWRWVTLTGDVSMFARLAQWAERGALHAKPYTAPNGWKTAKYTLTAHGRSLLRDGLPSLDQAPPLPIWGVTAYDPNNPWVVVEEPGGRPHLRRLGAG